MKIVGGFGGVRLDLSVSEGEVYSVVFDRRKAYCTQPEVIPEGWGAKTVNGKSLQKIDGYWLVFKGLFENVQLGDELKLKTLMKIIGRSQRTGVPITLYPKWNENVPDSVSYQVRCIDEWSAEDINIKKAVGQRIRDLIFETAERVDEPPYFVESEYLHLLAVGADTALAVGVNTALKIII